MQTLSHNRINIPNKSQEGRVLQVLKDANGDWVNKRYFYHTLNLTQPGRAIHNLENEPRWQAEYVGYEIEHSPFTDEYKFVSYRLKNKNTLF